MGRMQSSEIRRRFLDFFGERGHRLYPSASLIPHNDPTVLLTTGGVQQFIPYFLGQETPPSTRAMSAQKCFRTPDIEDVGDWHHLTFFEMLGNFSFGDYFKREAIEWAWAFLTEELGIEPERLWVTIFEGDEDAPEDVEAKEYWMGVGVPEERIFGLPKSENWWGPPGETGPCGPCSEIYYDYGEEAGLAQRQAGPAGDGRDRSVGEVAVLGQQDAGHRRVGRQPFGAGRILPDRDAEPAAAARLPQAQVDNAGDGVGAVLRGGAVAQHLDRADGGGGDGVEVDRGRAEADRAVQVDQGRGVLAL